MKDAQKTVGNAIDKAKFCYLSYIDENGFPQTRAMFAPRERDGINTLYLSTNTSSFKVKNLLNDNKACLYFADTRFYRGFSLSGTIEVSETEADKKRIWRAGDFIYYSKGVNDPDFCVLKFHTTEGWYYSNFKNEKFIVSEGDNENG